MTGPVHAQTSGEGSIYSRFGIGLLDDFSSSQSDALGGGAYALRSLNYNAIANPALWSDQAYTRLSAGASYQSINTTTGSESARLGTGSLDAVQFSFPLYERTLGVGISFQPYSHANYGARRSGGLSIARPDTSFSLPYEVNFQGSGGLHQLRGGLGYQVSEAVRVGAGVNVLFGIIENQRRTEFPAGSTYQNAVVSSVTQLSGVTGTVGTQVTLADVFASQDALSLGASVTLPASLSGDRVRTLDEDLAQDTLATQRGSVDLPWRAKMGLAYQPDEKWTVVVDGLYEPWGNFASDFTAPSGSFPSPFPVGGSQTLTNRWRLSAGAELVPAGTGNLDSYFSRMGYRFGGYVERLYVRPDAQTTLRTLGATGGLSFPTSLSGTRIDLNLKAGSRGSTSGSLVRDTFYGVALHVNFGERWFQQRKLR
jgi:hypothetical protein